jgi:hypothetical protein
VKQIRQIVLKNFLQDDHDRRAQHAAPDIAGATDHGDEEIFDAGLGAEGCRVHGALEVGIEPTGQSGEHSCVNKDQEFGARRMDAERLTCDVAVPQRADGAAGA